jgi:hypothetical protein
MGCIIQIPEDLLDTIEQEIYKFASGNLRISKQRVFTGTEMGGLGLFNVRNFLDAQICSWVKRCGTVDQVWKARLLAAGTGNLYQVHCAFGLGDLFPVLNNISRAHGNFVEKFTRSNKNYASAYLLNNKALTKGIRSREPLTLNDLNPTLADAPDIRHRLVHLKMSDLLTPLGKISLRTFVANLGVRIPDDLWITLDKIRNAALLCYNTGDREYGTSETMSDFFGKWKKGSRKIRCLLSKDKNEYIPHNMVKFADNMEVIIGCEMAKELNKSWTFYFYSNELRTFIFKLHNNTLPYNTILSHFVPGISRNCTFCDLMYNPVEEDETPLHLFFNCIGVEGLREEFYVWLLNDNNFTVSRNNFFIAFKLPNNFLNKALFVVTLLFKKLYGTANSAKLCLH